MMNKYYVEFAPVFEGGLHIAINTVSDRGRCLYVYAYSEQQVRDIFGDYVLVAIDQRG